MGHMVDLILDCGSLPVQPSSVVSLVDDRAEVLREGKGDISLFID
jgi:tRNA A37 threonylcarbamoyladenosine synthetase subunit TsaC/SUA5/YrdC